MFQTLVGVVVLRGKNPTVTDVDQTGARGDWKRRRLCEEILSAAEGTPGKLGCGLVGKQAALTQGNGLEPAAILTRGFEPGARDAGDDELGG